ncbi:cupin domain-containing protein [Paludibaculum fermentans]|jgi:mannose-6-phosphate isomerase-like protein (cupin superfamily)|uniref:cupin domain-containing protein n=1 Tax=Paludibaculum fermentans TaxID=1473598 RepID=UPI003EC01DCE
MPKRRDLFKAAAFLAPFAAAQGAGKLPDAALNPAQAKLVKEPFGDHRIYFDGPTDQLKSMTSGSLQLKAGMQPHPPHEHPEEEFVLVTEGTGEITVGGKVTKVAAGSMMYCAGNKVHGIVNTGKVPMTFFYYKWKA